MTDRRTHRQTNFIPLTADTEEKYVMRMRARKADKYRKVHIQERPNDSLFSFLKSVHTLMMYCGTHSSNCLQTDLNEDSASVEFYYSSSLVLSQYASITLPFKIVFNGGWSSMSLYIEKGLLSFKLRVGTRA